MNRIASRKEQEQYARLQALAFCPPELLSRQDKQLLIAKGFWKLTPRWRDATLFLVVERTPGAHVARQG